MLVQSQSAKEAVNVERQDIPCPLTGIHLLQENQLTAHNVRVASRQEFNHVGCARFLAAVQEYDTLATMYSRPLRLQFLGHGRQFLAYFNDMLVAIGPIFQEIEDFDDFVRCRLR